jgi:hypothetical protein
MSGLIRASATMACAAACHETLPRARRSVFAGSEVSHRCSVETIAALSPHAGTSRFAARRRTGHALSASERRAILLLGRKRPKAKSPRRFGPLFRWLQDGKGIARRELGIADSLECPPCNDANPLAAMLHARADCHVAGVAPVLREKYAPDERGVGGSERLLRDGDARSEHRSQQCDEASARYQPRCDATCPG